MQILVRLPNWLGDLVMSYAFLELLHQQYPKASIDVICKSNLVDLLPLFPNIRKVYAFDKAQQNTLFKIRHFAQSIGNIYDYFFCLPNSFSSAFMGFFTKAQNRIGYRHEMRSLLLTHAYAIPQNVHRVENYCQLLHFFAPQNSTFHKGQNTIFDTKQLPIPTHLPIEGQKKLIVLNLVSEDKRRTFDTQASCQIIDALQTAQPDAQIAIIGTKAAQQHFQTVLPHLQNTQNLLNLTTQTNLIDLAAVLQNATLLVSTDSGPAHLANSLKTPLIVFFGVGNALETAPFQQQNRTILDFNAIKPQEIIDLVKVF